MKSTVIKQGTYYLPMLLRDHDLALFVRHYTALRAPKTGNVKVQIETDVRYFDDEDALAEAIRDGDWVELPDEADGNTGYIPDDFRGLR